MGIIDVNVSGSKEVQAKLARLGLAGVHAGAASLYKSATLIMDESATLVPVETGTLRSTKIVLPPDIQGTRVVVRLGYGGPAAPYALAVHENPRAGKTGGISPGGKKYRRWAQTGQWKYLETPVKAHTQDVVNQLISDLNRAIGEL